MCPHVAQGKNSGTSSSCEDTVPSDSGPAFTTLLNFYQLTGPISNMVTLGVGLQQMNERDTSHSGIGLTLMISL
jgi:hypothetical protein